MRYPILSLLAWTITFHSAQAVAEYQGPGFYYSPASTITTSASITTTSAVVIAANPLRKGLIMFNNSANSVYLTYGPTSVAATCTRILPTFTQFEMLGPSIYTGVISGIRNSGSGTITVTEFQ